MKKLALFALLLTACQPEAGRARLEFVFSEDVELDSAVYVFARIEDRSTGTNLGGVGPISLAPGESKEVPAISVPNGDERVAIVEIRDGMSSDTQIRFYGISAPFSIKPGEITDVLIQVGLKRPPVAGQIMIEGSSEIDAVLFTAVPDVMLQLDTDNAVEVQLSNFVDLPEQPCSDAPAPCSTTVQLSGGEPVPDRPGVSRYTVPWNINRGLDVECVEQDYCPRYVFARFFDRQGYASEVVSVDVVLDTKNPGVIPSSYSVRIQPPPGNPLAFVTQATVNSSVAVSFTMTEPVTMPVVKAGGEELACDQAGLSYRCTILWGTAVADGTVTVTIDSVDRALHEGHEELTGFIVDTVNPSAPNTDPGMIVYQRMPWGTPASPGPRFNLHGAPGAVDPGAWLIAYTRPEIEIPALGEPAGEIGRVQTDAADGSFDLDLRADRESVFVVAVDLAGNISGQAGNIVPATEVRDAEWTGTLLQSGANPNRAIIAQHLGPSLEQDPNSARAAGPDEMDALGGGGANPVDIPWAAQWQEHTINGDTPSARENHALAYDQRRGRVVLFGGTEVATAELDDTWEWDGFGWREVVPPGALRPDPRNRHAMAYDPLRGVTVLFGGQTRGTAGAEETNDTWLWDGTSWTEALPANMPEPRRYHSMAWDGGRGKVLLFGGVLEGQTRTYYDNTWIWNGKDWEDAQPADHPSPRAAAMMAYDPIRDRVVLFGGLFIDGTGAATDLGDTWEWDGSNWIERTSSSTTAPSPRLSGTMTFSSVRGEIVLHGGRPCGPNPLCSNPPNLYDDAWSWNGTRWRRLSLSGDLPPPVDDHSIIEDTARGQLLIFGGGVVGAPLPNTLIEVERDRWRDVTPNGASPTGRLFAGAAFDEASRQVTMMGGTADPFGAWETDTWIWDGWNWRMVETGTPLVDLPQVIWDPSRNRLVLIGCTAGCLAFGPSGPMEIWERGASGPWQQVLNSGFEEPLPRPLGSTAYDPALAQTWFFGGAIPDPDFGIIYGAGDLWGWNGDLWTLLFAPLEPPDPTLAPASFGHRSVGDLDRQRVVVFGGMNENGPVFTQWEWDGATASWLAVTPTSPTSPDPRVDHAMVYDSDRRRTVLFGGQTDFGPQNDLWTFDGATSHWQRIPWVGNGPIERSAAAMAYDPDRRRLLVFGGADLGGIPRPDTWELALESGERPGAILIFQWAPSGDGNDAIQTITIDSVAGGLGFTDDGAGSGSQMDGAELQVWDAWSGTWRSQAMNDAPRDAPAALATVTTGADAVRAVDGNGRLYLRFQPKQGLGNGAEPGAVSLDDVSVTIRYRR